MNRDKIDRPYTDAPYSGRDTSACDRFRGRTISLAITSRPTGTRPAPITTPKPPPTQVHSAPGGGRRTRSEPCAHLLPKISAFIISRSTATATCKQPCSRQTHSVSPNRRSRPATSHHPEPPLMRAGFAPREAQSRVCRVPFAPQPASGFRYNAPLFSQTILQT